MRLQSHHITLSPSSSLSSSPSALNKLSFSLFSEDRGILGFVGAGAGQVRGPRLRRRPPSGQPRPRAAEAGAAGVEDARHLPAEVRHRRARLLREPAAAEGARLRPSLHALLPRCASHSTSETTRLYQLCTVISPPRIICDRGPASTVRILRFRRWSALEHSLSPI